MSEKSSKGIISRAAFLTLLENKMAQSEMANIVGNGMALVLLKGPERIAFLDQWRKKSKNSESVRLVNHMITHAQSYSGIGFSRTLSLLQQSSETLTLEEWIPALQVIHDGTHIALGTEEYHTIRGFCETLSKPRKLESRRHKMDSIHLAPRVICDPTPLGNILNLSSTQSANDWLGVSYLRGPETDVFSVTEANGDRIVSIDYWLNIEDVYPSSGGLISQGKDIVRAALIRLGVLTESHATFTGRIELADRQMKSKEIAVLERLSSGSLEVLANTLVGSPQVVESLLKKGQIALWPDFNHIGVSPDFVLQGEYKGLLNIVKSYCLEGTVISTDSEAIAVVSAPTNWKNPLIEAVSKNGISLWPIRSIRSPRNIIRDEEPFSTSESVFTWSEGSI
jgi:hypothetical protein